MQRCPNCNARCDGGSACRRCGMDLDLLIRVEQAAERLVGQALAQLAAADPEAAVHSLTQALALHRTADAEQLLGFVRHADARQPESWPSPAYPQKPDDARAASARTDPWS
jgi:hypothetical protein